MCNQLVFICEDEIAHVLAQGVPKFRGFLTQIKRRCIISFFVNYSLMLNWIWDRARNGDKLIEGKLHRSIVFVDYAWALITNAKWAQSGQLVLLWNTRPGIHSYNCSMGNFLTWTWCGLHGIATRLPLLQDDSGTALVILQIVVASGILCWKLVLIRIWFFLQWPGIVLCNLCSPYNRCYSRRCDQLVTPTL